ncbi:MAG: tRNA (adenosine(37)-N6)-dimethylallyltransferase MiaA [Legionella sp.]|nr:MAG: tRNA (adenosine(37)-N6)-dimethylallyltransferase MiaA [Legionella sp.]PJD97707.1 MAG: tRNA (adenosine(37)-N6)-dimethylallyltransferase MiaA [Legionella sp.]
MSNLVFCLMGPTASGKTALACDWVQRFPFEIVSVDSAMIYRGMDIGTAKPSAEELTKAPHHLIDLISPLESYSAAQFCTDAQQQCERIIATGKIPLLVGGTMMYFNALQQGLATLPEADALLRAQMEAEAALKGWHVLHARLAIVDPEAAARIHVHDTQRIQRALEVYALTGIPLSIFLKEQKANAAYSFVNLALMPEPRQGLHQRIEKRFDLMLQQGFIEEVLHLQQQWALNPELPSMRCVGYRQVLEYLAGVYDRATLREKGIVATRQLAKRQLTWLRQWPSASYYNSEEHGFEREMIAKIKEIIDNNLL